MSNKTFIGLDIGYSAVKCKSSTGQFTFPSVVGTPEKSQFSLSDSSIPNILSYRNQNYNYGNEALLHSRITSRKETRNWFQSDQYMVLLNAALYRATKGKSNENLVVVTGLPVSFYESDRKEMKTKFEGTHVVTMYQRPAVQIRIKRCFVIPQVMGTLLDAALNDEGNIADIEIAMGRIGVIDIGGKTTNMLHAYKLGDIHSETIGLDIGGWDIVRAVRPLVEERTPDTAWSDHEIAKVVIDKSIRFKGENIDMAGEVDSILNPMAEKIADEANRLWSGKIEQILLSGGGALMMGDRLMEMIDHGKIRVVENSEFANVRGYYKAAMFYGNK